MSAQDATRRAIRDRSTVTIVTAILAACAGRPGAPPQLFTLSVFGRNGVQGRRLPAGGPQWLVAAASPATGSI